jgi:SAM-dependent methyltransferase
MFSQHDPHLSEALSIRLRTNYRGDLTGVRVYRNGEQTEYERTNRRAHAIFDSPDAELGEFFRSSRDFAKVMGDGPVLDLGCGGGGLVKDLRTLGVQAFGLDLVLDPSCVATQGFVRGDAYTPPFHPGSFQCIVSIFSVFHYEPAAAIPHLLDRCLDLLAPDGRILINAIHHQDSYRALVKRAHEREATVFQDLAEGALQIIRNKQKSDSRHRN